MEFKGTKGKWYHFKNHSQVVLDGEYMLNVEGFGIEKAYNARLISKAPEMLEMLQKINSIENEEFCKESFNIEDLKRKLSRLIKEATEL